MVAENLNDCVECAPPELDDCLQRRVKMQKKDDTVFVVNIGKCFERWYCECRGQFVCGSKAGVQHLEATAQLHL